MRISNVVIVFSMYITYKSQVEVENRKTHFQTNLKQQLQDEYVRNNTSNNAGKM